MIKIVIGVIIVIASLATIPSMSGSGAYFAGQVMGKLIILAIGVLLIISGAKGRGAK
jgi:hypothetical protein